MRCKTNSLNVSILLQKLKPVTRTKVMEMKKAEFKTNNVLSEFVKIVLGAGEKYESIRTSPVNEPKPYSPALTMMAKNETNILQPIPVGKPTPPNTPPLCLKAILPNDGTPEMMPESLSQKEKLHKIDVVIIEDNDNDFKTENNETLPVPEPIPVTPAKQFADKSFQTDNDPLLVTKPEYTLLQYLKAIPRRNLRRVMSLLQTINIDQEIINILYDINNNVLSQSTDEVEVIDINDEEDEVSSELIDKLINQSVQNKAAINDFFKICSDLNVDPFSKAIENPSLTRQLKFDKAVNISNVINQVLKSVDDKNPNPCSTNDQTPENKEDESMAIKPQAEVETKQAPFANESHNTETQASQIVQYTKQVSKVKPKKNNLPKQVQIYQQNKQQLPPLCQQNEINHSGVYQQLQNPYIHQNYTQHVNYHQQQQLQQQLQNTMQFANAYLPDEMSNNHMMNHLQMQQMQQMQPKQHSPPPMWNTTATVTSNAVGSAPPVPAYFHQGPRIPSPLPPNQNLQNNCQQVAQKLRVKYPSGRNWKAPYLPHPQSIVNQSQMQEIPRTWEAPLQNYPNGPWIQNYNNINQ